MHEIVQKTQKALFDCFYSLKELLITIVLTSVELTRHIFVSKKWYWPLSLFVRVKLTVISLDWVVKKKTKNWAGVPPKWLTNMPKSTNSSSNVFVKPIKLQMWKIINQTFYLKYPYRYHTCMYMYILTNVQIYS